MKESESSLFVEESCVRALFADAEPVPVLLLRHPSYSVEFVVVREEANLQPELYSMLASLLKALSLIPAVSMIDRIVLLTNAQHDSQIPAATVNAACSMNRKKLNSKNQISISLPYGGVSPERDLVGAWVEIVSEKCPVQAYLFDLVFLVFPQVQVAASSVPVYGSAAALLQHVANATLKPRSQLTQAALGEADLDPILQLIFCSFVLASLQQSRSKNKQDAAFESMFRQRQYALRLRYLQDCAESLLRVIQNEKVSAEAAAKLLLYIGETEHLEKIKKARQLSFDGEPVGEFVLQRLKHVHCIESLDLSFTFFPSEALRNLSYLPLLKTLSIANTRTANNGIRALASCPALEELNCSNTLISSDGARAFLKFKRLRKIHAAGLGLPAELTQELQSKGIEALT